MHKGIVLEDGRVYHNTPLRGEHVSSFKKFCKNKRVDVQHLDDSLRRDALNAINSGCTRPYNPFTNNCEHTVSRAATGQGESPQLSSLVISGGVAVVTLAFTRSWVLATAGFALTRKLTSRRRARSHLSFD